MKYAAFFLLCLFISSCERKTIPLSDEYFGVRSFEDLTPNEEGRVFLDDQWVDPLIVKNLRFADSGLNNFEIKTLPDELALFKNVEYLWIGMRGFAELPAVVLQLENLKDLDLQHGHIKSLPPDIYKLKNLEKLVLLGSGIQTIPEEIKRLDKLKHIHLGLTKLNTFPKEIGRLKNLEQLFIGDFEDFNRWNDSLSITQICETLDSKEVVVNMIKCEELRRKGWSENLRNYQR